MLGFWGINEVFTAADCKIKKISGVILRIMGIFLKA